MAYSRTYDIPYFLIDQNRKLRITALMKFLEDMAIRHSESCGVGLDYYYSNGVAWLLAKWDIEVLSYPEFSRTIEISTAPTSFRNFFGFRKFEVMDCTGKLLAKAHTLWIFVDTNKKKPIPVTDEVVRAYGLTPEKKQPLPMEAPSAPANSTWKSRFYIRPGDIDTNHHVNNIRFVEWALDTLPVEFTTSHSVQRVLVDYRQELTLGDDVFATAEMLENEYSRETRHRISNGKKDVSLITFRWT